MMALSRAFLKSSSSRRFVISFLLFQLTMSAINGVAGTELCKFGDGDFKEFDSSRKICCENSLHSAHTYMCCNGTRHKKEVFSTDDSKREERMCCGDQVVNKESHLMCCGGNLISLNETQVKFRDNLICCGETYITVNEQWCCGGLPVEANQGCCGGKKFDKQSKKCKNNEIMEFDEDLCSGQKYNYKSARCCGGKLHTGTSQRDRSFDCCGQDLIDGTKEKCCLVQETGFPTHKIPANSECCGETHFARPQECVNGIPVTWEKHEGKCGFHVIDTRTHGCCGNSMPYDKKTEKCCIGSGLRILRKDEECCNGYHLKANEICCQKKRPCRKTAQDDDECCYNIRTRKGITYKSTENKTCVNGRLLQRDQPRRIKCHNLSYLISKEMCCGHTVYTRKEGCACCVKTGRPYKISEGGCFTNPERKQSNGKNESVRSKSNSPSQAVCGSYKINKRTMSCCRIFPYRKSSKRRRCCKGRELYNRRISIGTKSGKIRPRSSSIHNICHRSFFDGGVEATCSKKYAILGKMRNIITKPYEDSNTVIVTMYLKRVKALQRRNGLPKHQAPRSLAISVRTTIAKSKQCLKYYRKKFRKLLMFFDEPIKGKEVQIIEDSSLFITKNSRRRYRDVTWSITKEVCQTYQKRAS